MTSQRKNRERSSKNSHFIRWMEESVCFKKTQLEELMDQLVAMQGMKTKR